MRKIAVIGTGYVGLVSGTCFADVGHQVICSDIDSSKINKLKAGKIPIYEPGLEELVQKNVQKNRLTFTTDIPHAIRESEVIYIAVGTPMAESGQADLTYVKNVARTIGQHLNDYKVVVNKSTVPVGTGQIVRRIIQEHIRENIDFDVVSNPEFLREGSAVDDTFNMERAVIGAASEKAARIIEEIHEPFKTTIIKTNVESAEMIKYASNAFLAAKISFINDIANICERVGADVTKVAEGMGLDGRIGPKFLQAGIGFGGSCFPKDTQALIHIAEQAGYDFKMLKAVIDTNEKQRMVVVHKLKSILPDLNGKTIAVLGLAFKPNTNDMRDAPSIDVVSALLSEGAVVKAFDPIANDEARQYFQDSVHYARDVYAALEQADACIILTDWPEVRKLNLSQVKQVMNKPIVIDGRNCFELQAAEDAQLHYYSIGRPSVTEQERLKI